MKTFKVLKITNNLEDYPEYTKDTIMFPDLIPHVEDEVEFFVYCVQTGEWWEADEFFNIVDADMFYMDYEEEQ